MSEPASPSRTAAQGALRWALLALAGLILVAVFALWRSGSGATRSAPSPDTVPGQLFLDEAFAVRLWMPTPAANVSSLVPVEALERWLGNVRFGSFSLPPAREAALALQSSGGVAAFRFAPWQATLARWAGGLAGNPLLSGGRIERASGELTTRWIESTWLVSFDADWAPGSASSGPTTLVPAIGWLALGESSRRELATLLRLGSSRAELSKAPFELVELEGGWGLRQENALWASRFEGPAGAELAAARFQSSVSGWELTVLEAPQGPARAGELRLPSSGARSTAEFSAGQLPGGRWLEDLALSPLFSECGEQTCVAWDRRGLELAESSSVPVAGASGTSVWIWNRELTEFLQRFAAGLEGLLLVPTAEVEQARAAARWAEPLELWERADLRYEGGAVAVRFWDAAPIDSSTPLP